MFKIVQLAFKAFNSRQPVHQDDILLSVPSKSSLRNDFEARFQEPIVKGRFLEPIVYSYSNKLFTWCLTGPYKPLPKHVRLAPVELQPLTIL